WTRARRPGQGWPTAICASAATPFGASTGSPRGGSACSRRGTWSVVRA
ncbi:MAG: hypothetical protein AVDCRST_MAG19-1889, partial [uncultured Thermomicrobiales bacterium]